MSFKERFLNYVKFDTTSNEEYEDRPSNLNEFELAKLLQNELEDLGVQNVFINEFATVYGYFPVPTFSFDEKGVLCILKRVCLSNKGK